MKKITLLLLFLFFSISGYSQLPLEGFENTTGPDGPPSTNWTLGTGNWAVFNNGVGTNVEWTINTAFPYQGLNAAYANRENIGAGNTSEDFLATPVVQIPTNGVLHFYTRMFTSGDQGTIYQIRVAPALASQTDPFAYSLVQQWTENDLIIPTSNFNVYTEKTVDLGTAFAGQFVYVAFVRVFTQPDGTLGGDRWLVDNVSIDAACLAPTALTAGTITSNSATLNWTNPNGTVNGWEVIATPSVGAPIVYPLYTGTLPFVATGLSPNTTYTYTVRAICTTGFSSPWSAASASFTTQVAPPVCGGNFVDPGGVSANYGNNANVTTTICPTTPGELVTVTFTAFNTESGADLLKVYDGNDATAPLLATLSGTALPPAYTASSANGCLTFVFTSNATTTAAGWASNVTCNPPPTCRKPTALSSNTVTSNSVNLTWTQPANPDTSVASAWEVLALPCGSLPPTAGSTGFVSAPTNPFTLTGLTSATCYDIYVRAVCSVTDSSTWAGPTTITTQLSPPVCGGNFVDTGGLAANYPNNANQTTTICPTTPGDVVTITFTSFNTQAGSDLLKIYDGNDATAPLLATLSGTTLPPAFTSSAATGCLTFVFTSNATTNAAGWVSNITCGPPPGCRNPTTLTSGAVLSTSVVLNWIQPANPDTSVATTWNVLALPCGSPAPNASSTGYVTATTNPFTLTGLSPTTCYDIYVRAECAALTYSTWTGPVTITTQIAPPVCGGTFVDPGGTGNYANSLDSTVTICPVTAGDVVTVTFTAFDTEATWDGLYVFDGNSIAAPQIASANGAGNVPGGLAGSYWGTTIPGPFTSTSATGCLTFRFRTDTSGTRAGWTANVTCGPPPTCIAPTGITAGTVTSNSVILNWTQPVNPDTTVASAWEVLALPCGSPLPTPTSTGFVSASTNPFTLTGLSSATCYDIYIRAVCSPTDSSSWGGPRTITTQVAPPVCGGNFVDPGGPSDYTNNLDSTVTICPTTPGEVVTVTFTSFNTEANWDGLYVFDGNSITAPQIASTNGAGNVPGGLAGSFWGTTIPGPFTSTSADGCLTFRFRTDGSGVRAGWLANVTCAPPPTCRTPTAITSNTVTHNSVILNWTQPINPDTTVASAWEVLALPCGSPLPTATSTGFVSASSSPFTLTGLTPSTCYDIYIRAVCSATDSSTWGGPRTITTQVAPPVCGGTYVDAGGPTANYANSSDITTTICPTTPGDVVTVTFSEFNTETNWDGILVYDGNSTAAPQIASANGTGNGPFATITGAYWGNLTGANIPGPFTSSASNGCLTFRFLSDASFNNPGWLANVTCAPAPECQRPNTLTATEISTTSAYLGWTEPSGNVTQWQVLVLPVGSPAPLPDATGWVTVSTNPALFTGLTPGTRYTFYVRGVCATSGTSAWSTGFNFSTLIINDNCDGAIFVPVNSDAVCEQIGSGTLTGATPSVAPGITAPCVGVADDDVWFQFIATNSYLNLSLQSIVGSTTNLNFAVYSGNCGTLTQIFCSAANSSSGVLNGLIVGNTYYIRVYSNSGTAQTVNFNICISTPSTCSNSSSVCSVTGLAYGNTTGVTSLGTIGCLNTSPNPTFFTIQIVNNGPINYLLTQSTTPGGTPNLDVDYAAWGPFNSQAEVCAAIGSGQTPLTGLTTGCSYSAAPTENFNIANAIAGQYYVILITNFSNNPGYISLTQTNASAPGAGLTLCCPDADFHYASATYCKDPSIPNPVAIIETGSVAGVFSLLPSTPTGLVFANTATGEIDLQASAPGNYVVLNTVAANGSCAQKTHTFTISIVAPPVATISYNSNFYCQNVSTLQNVTQTGTPGGTYSVTPNGGLYINVANGDINPSLSSPGIYTISYSIPGTSVCVGANPSFQVEIGAKPNIIQPDPVYACDSYTLPDLAVGNYFDAPGGTGNQLNAGDVISTLGAHTLYIYAINAQGCYNEKTLSITIHTVPAPTYSTAPSACTSPTGNITYLTPAGSSPIPSDLFISEVTDANTGSLTYIELFNGTGTTRDLANYKLKIYNNGSSLASCDLTLSGNIANNTTKVIAVGSATNAGGVIPDLVFASCGGVNTDDNIRLTSASDVVIDNWGRTDGIAFTPSNQAGYVYRRNNTAIAPSTTWDPAEWTALDPEDYTNVGSYSALASNYEYSIDNGVTYQSGMVFNNIAAGDYTLVVRDLVTHCTSTPINVTVDPLNPTVAITGFSYTTPVCQNATPNPMPGGFATGFTVGGTYSEDSSTSGLVFVSTSTGEINLTSSTPGTHIVNYTVANDAATCLTGGQSSATIVINPVISPIVEGVSYTTPICKNAQDTVTPTLPTGFSSFATFSATPSGLVINSNTGVIDLVNSAVGIYNIVIDVIADPGTCRIAATSTPIPFEIKPVITLVTGFNYDSPFCADGGSALPNTDPGFATGGTFSSTAGLTIDPSTGAIDLASTPGTYTVTYTANPNVGNCEVATPGTAQVTIVSPVSIELIGGCQGPTYILSASGSFPETATFSWHDASGSEVSTAQSFTVTAVGVYTVTVTVDGCSTTSAGFDVESVFCIIQKGISVNNDGLNDTFDLTGYDVKKLTIFNRLGMKVYSRNDYVDQWGGRSDDGDELPDGTYYFIIDRNNGETKTGWIYINRAQ